MEANFMHMCLKVYKSGIYMLKNGTFVNPVVGVMLVRLATIICWVISGQQGMFSKSSLFSRETNNYWCCLFATFTVIFYSDIEKSIIHPSAWRVNNWLLLFTHKIGDFWTWVIFAVVLYDTLHSYIYIYMHTYMNMYIYIWDALMRLIFSVLRRRM